MDSIQQLEHSEEPVVRYKVLTELLGKSERTMIVKETREEIRNSERSQALINHAIERMGKFNAYKKWSGSHWTLANLAEDGYPTGDAKLFPLRDQVYEWLLSKSFVKRLEKIYIKNKMRMCASMEGNAIYSTITLGIEDKRIEPLIERLLKYQWDDGGWNCDKNPHAHVSSFHETLIPMRALFYYGSKYKHNDALDAAYRASEVFLKRKLFKTLKDDSIMDGSFLDIRYPFFWYYTILFGLKVMVEMDLLKDKRCSEALDALENLRLSDGGFSNSSKVVQFTQPDKPSYLAYRYGQRGKKTMNEFVTVEALSILKKS